MSEVLDSRDGDAEAPPVLPVAAYLAVFVGLLGITSATVVLSYLEIGPAANHAVLLLAIIQAALILGIFMNLRNECPVHQLVIVTSLVLAAILAGLPFLDLTNRSRVLAEHGNAGLAAERAISRQLKRVQQNPPTHPIDVPAGVGIARTAVPAISPPAAAASQPIAATASPQPAKAEALPSGKPQPSQPASSP